MAKCVLAFLLVLIILITHLFDRCVLCQRGNKHSTHLRAQKSEVVKKLSCSAFQPKRSPTYCNHITMPTCSTVYTSKYRTLFHLLSWTIPTCYVVPPFVLPVCMMCPFLPKPAFIKRDWMSPPPPPPPPPPPFPSPPWRLTYLCTSLPPSSLILILSASLRSLSLILFRRRQGFPELALPVNGSREEKLEPWKNLFVEAKICPFQGLSLFELFPSTPGSDTTSL